jgi:hypothetical protein
MFQDPQHANYITLMLELRPPRDWQPGDWYWSDEAGEPTLIDRSDDGPDPRFRDPV